MTREEASAAPDVSYKRRRLQGACDICRYKKVRCDSAKMPGNRCSNCIAFNSECTHLDIKKRGTSKRLAFARITSAAYPTMMDADSTRPDSSITSSYAGSSHKSAQSLTAEILSTSGLFDIPKDASVVRQHFMELAQYVRSLEKELASKRDSLSRDFLSGDSASSGAHTSAPPSIHLRHPEVPVSADADEGAVVALSDQLKRMTTTSSHNRYHGLSSSLMLVKTVVDIKKEFNGEEAEFVEQRTPDTRRPEFWHILPWERGPPEAPPPQIFPESDLLQHLVDIYFANVNAHVPLLHRPTFERSVAEGLHFRDHLFGATLLSVCALASRYSEDPRVILEGSGSEHSAGWKWSRQIQFVRKSFMEPPSLYELQTYCISVLYLQATSTPEVCWVLLSLGIRFAQEVGAHRRKPKVKLWTVEDELWKRAFWTLICIDAIMCSFLGRPRAMHCDDFDLDMPIECDDEYWEHSDPELAFKQPPGKPSSITYFVLMLKLLDILGFAQRTVFSVKRSKMWPGTTSEQWDQQIVSELDSALKEWIDSIPDHLRWDPYRDNHPFFDQSAVLHTSYYFIQMQIHRPYIPSSGKRSPLSFPSLAICTNAARSCSHIMDVQSRRGFLPLPHVQMALFTSAIVLLFNVWGGKQSGLCLDTTKAMGDVHKCMDVLRTYERRWQTAGRLWDILYELSSIGKLPLPSNPPSTKRRREFEESGSSHVDPQLILAEPAGNIIFSDPMPFPPPQPQPSQRDQLPSHELQHTFMLPVYSHELGQLPVHGIDFSTEYQAFLGLDHDLSLPAQRPATSHSVPRNATVQYPIYAGHAPTGGDQLLTNSLDLAMTVVWPDAPIGYDWDEWGPYFADIDELTQSLHHAQPHNN